MLLFEYGLGVYRQTINRTCNQVNKLLKATVADTFLLRPKHFALLLSHVFHEA